LEAQSILNQIAQSRNLKENTEFLRTSNADLENTCGLMKNESKIESTLNGNGASGSLTLIIGNSKKPTSHVNDSDSETDAIFNEFQIKRFPHRKDI
jgi:hypothetical protein